MAFTELLFKDGYAAERLAEAKATLKANKGTDDFTGFALRVIRNRLSEDPKRYRDYGPYWWALKKVLMAHGMAKGSTVDEEVAAVYCGANDEETIILADDFRDRIYLENFFVYANSFVLDADADEEYVLLDPDYEGFARAMDIELI